MHAGMFRNQRPVEPANLVVLAIGIVVATLGATDFVAHDEHRNSQRKQSDGQEILDLSVSQVFNFGRAGWPLDTTVPATIVGAVAVFFAVGLVVLLVVGNQVIQGKSVVTGHEVDALFGLALLVTIHFMAAEQAIGEMPHCPWFGAKETAHIIAKPPIPFFPAVSNKTAYLIQAGGVPRFGDEPGTGQSRV